MLKVAIVSTLPPINTSLSEYGKFLVEGLLESTENLELHVLADIAHLSEPIQEMQHERLEITRCWQFNDWTNPFKLMRQLMQIKPDLVLFNLQFASFSNQKIPAMLGLSTPMIAKAFGFKVITIMHNLPEAMNLDAPYFSKSRLDKWLIQTGSKVATKLLLQSDRLVVTLDKYRELLQAKYHADNIDVIGLGSYVKPAETVQMVNHNRLLTFGKFGTYKRLEPLLEIFNEVSQENPDAELIIGGSDHPNTPGYIASMQAKYAHLKNVKFIGWISDDELPEVIRNCKALVLSYESTAGSSGPLHLALSQGKAVIAPDFGDFRLVADNENVKIVFYKQGNSLDLKHKMNLLLKNKLDLQAMGEHNLKLAHEHSCDKTARRYLNLIYQTLRHKTKQDIEKSILEHSLSPHLRKAG